MSMPLDTTLSDTWSRVTVHPSFNALYYSFYAESLGRFFPQRQWQLECEGFPQLDHHCLALRIQSSSPGAAEHKLYISAGDGAGLNHAALEWCDLYAKVNLDFDQLSPADRQIGLGSKLFALGPNFPVRAWSPLNAATMIARTVARGGLREAVSPREHVANYWRQWSYRLPEHCYTAQPGDPNYVFFTSTLWKKQARTNQLRADFVRACRNVQNLRFEGGFSPRRGSAVPGFEDCIGPARMSLDQYLTGIQRSAVVFNTPAVQDCHGWKLGEFLALGKAIITTPLTRALPAPLEHGKHLHVIDPEDEADFSNALRDTIERLCQDHEYRRHLEHHARAYYDAYLTPRRVVERCWAALEARAANAKAPAKAPSPPTPTSSPENLR